MSDGKREFRNLINFINTNNIVIPDNIKPYLTNLIEKWNNEQKTTNDYFEMKNNHTQLGYYMISSNNSELTELWNKYIDTAMTYRVQRMAIDDSNNKFTNRKLFLTNDNLGVSFYTSN